MITKKEIIIVGPRVLIAPETEEKTRAGLYLPPTVKEKEEVSGGLIIKTGPGYPMAESATNSEPWEDSNRKPSYIPLQAKEGDYAIFLKKDAVEIEYEGKKYLIVPHSSILALIRTVIAEE
ncbi:MAG: co-chaperone GroES [Nitrospirae bacterium]|nr:MAG: co-chaperone GroES [Nitrospirota bacterium]